MVDDDKRSTKTVRILSFDVCMKPVCSRLDSYGGNIGERLERWDPATISSTFWGIAIPLSYLVDAIIIICHWFVYSMSVNCDTFAIVEKISDYKFELIVLVNPDSLRRPASIDADNIATNTIWTSGHPCHIPVHDPFICFDERSNNRKEKRKKPPN